MTRITLKLFAGLGDYLPAGTRDNRMELDIEASDTVQDVLTRQKIPGHLAHLVLVNGVYIPPAARASQGLRPGDQLAVWPPIAGG